MKLTKEQLAEVHSEVERQLEQRKLGKAAITRFKKIRSEFRQQTFTAILAAFSLLIALSWKDVISNAVNSLVNQLFLVGQNSSLASLISAVLVTYVCVLGIILVSRWADKGKE